MNNEIKGCPSLLEITSEVPGVESLKNLLLLSISSGYTKWKGRECEKSGYKPLFSKGFSFRTWQLWLCKIQKIQKMTARVGKPCCTQLIAYSSGTNANHWIAVVASCPLQWSSHFLWPKLWKSCCISNLQPVLTVPSSWLCLLLVGQRSTMNLQP
ncbi:uncharacterized protein LOC111240883 [Vigna radiata var. radiata]|uniref:Uncharacterized protein LOC111240883 n=1 Tax=Vigna radiata var. radiata TaxID=3916 RepID=A0A3Q0ELP1_VIGRR|nr:uncharacterized protein LOC111240883 [Vigna radiata var. radiata]